MNTDDLRHRHSRHSWIDVNRERQQSRQIRPNGKLIAENAKEYYQLPCVHTEPCKISEIAADWFLVSRAPRPSLGCRPVWIPRLIPGRQMCDRFEYSGHRYQNWVIDRMIGRGGVPRGDAGDNPGWVGVLRLSAPRAKVLVCAKAHPMPNTHATPC